MTKTLALLERDVVILQFIAKFGYCQQRHIEFLCGLSDKYAIKVLKRLVDADLVVREKVLAYKDTCLWLTKNGAKFVGIASISKPALNTLNHDALLIELYFKLKQNYPESIIITDKELRRGIGIHKSGNTERIPDLLIDDSIAIELELSEKALDKLQYIINSYMITESISEVRYYFTSTRIYTKVASLTYNYAKFKFFMLALDANGINSIIELNSDKNILAATNPAIKKFGGYTYLA